MFRIGISILLLFSGVARSDINSSLFIDGLNEALRQQIKASANAVRVVDITSVFDPSKQVGFIDKGVIENISETKFNEFKEILEAKRVTWEPSNVSALAEKGASLIIFLDKNGNAIFGLYHENRWNTYQHAAAFVSGSIDKGFAFEGIVKLSIIRKDRTHPRDVPYVLELHHAEVNR